MQNIQGSYCYDVASYTGTTFHLENGKFTSHYFTDVVLPHRRKKKPEVPGRYTLNGQRLTVVWPRGGRIELILTYHPSHFYLRWSDIYGEFAFPIHYRRGHFILWWPEEYDKYLRTGEIPWDTNRQQ